MSEVLIRCSTKEDGNQDFRWDTQAEVEQNREAFLAKMDLTPADCVVMEVEHDDSIEHVGRDDRGRTIKIEALATADEGVALFLLTADCFPVVLHDLRTDAIAIAHAGWKPTDKQLIPKVISEMSARYGTRAEDVHAYIGPGIRPESYLFENPPQRGLPGWSPYLKELPDGTTQVDLLGYLTHQLRECGIAERNTQVSDIDTAASPEYFSHYRSVRTGEPQGRFATVVVRR